MKLKKFFEIAAQSEEPFDDEDNFGDMPNIIDEDEVTDDDVVETLLSTLRKMIKNSNIENFYVYVDGDGCINIQFVLNKKERYSSIIKIMNLLKKFESDILIQYDSEFDLWESKEGDPIITAKFYYDEDVSNPTFEEEEEEKGNKNDFDEIDNDASSYFNSDEFYDDSKFPF